MWPTWKMSDSINSAALIYDGKYAKLDDSGLSPFNGPSVTPHAVHDLRSFINSFTSTTTDCSGLTQTSGRPFPFEEARTFLGREFSPVFATNDFFSVLLTSCNSRNVYPLPTRETGEKEGDDKENVRTTESHC